MAAGTALVDAPGRHLRPARVLSLAFQPILTGTYLLVALSVVGSDSLAAALAWAALLAGLTAGMPALDLYLRVRTGRIDDFQLVLREQRREPLLVALAWTAVGLLAAWLLGAPEVLTTALVVAVVNGAVLTVVTAWWKISFHTATLTSAVLVLAWATGPVLLVLGVLVPAVGWSRVRLGRHTPAQAAAGALLAAGLTSAILAAA